MEEIQNPIRRRTARALACVGLVALALASCCASPSVPESLPAQILTPQEEELQEFRLGPNDIVRIGVYRHPELSTPASERFDGTRVDPDGLLSLPLIGPIEVEGLTLTEARAKVTEAFSQYLQEPRLDLSVITYAARRFYIFGDVETPGPYEMDRPLTVYQALSFGGGFRSTADRRRVVLLRKTAGETEVHVINAEELEGAGLKTVHPDDFLFVMRTGTGRFADEVLPILTGISATLASVATILLIEDRLN